jgi:hypothetical protein
LLSTPVASIFPCTVAPLGRDYQTVEETAMPSKPKEVFISITVDSLQQMLNGIIAMFLNEDHPKQHFHFHVSPEQLQNW